VSNPAPGEPTRFREGKAVVSDTIAALQATVPRRVSLRFDGTVDPQRFASIDGVELVDAGTDHVDLKVRGPVDAVVKAAAELTTIDVVAAPADLEELFLSFYDETTDGR
jgi:ABC-2 type transport system ATP-binding protein